MMRCSSGYLIFFPSRTHWSRTGTTLSCGWLIGFNLEKRLLLADFSVVVVADPVWHVRISEIIAFVAVRGFTLQELFNIVEKIVEAIDSENWRDDRVLGKGFFFTFSGGREE